VGLEHSREKPKAAKAAMNPCMRKMAAFGGSWQPSRLGRSQWQDLGEAEHQAVRHLKARSYARLGDARRLLDELHGAGDAS
jgi:hypothetical protein